MKMIKMMLAGLLASAVMLTPAFAKAEENDVLYCGTDGGVLITFQYDRHNSNYHLTMFDNNSGSRIYLAGDGGQFETELHQGAGLYSRDVYLNAAGKSINIGYTFYDNQETVGVNLEVGDKVHEYICTKDIVNNMTNPAYFADMRVRQ